MFSFLSQHNNLEIQDEKKGWGFMHRIVKALLKSSSGKISW
jgi:hypothetical protein